jgi:hypothetical protein
LNASHQRNHLVSGLFLTLHALAKLANQGRIFRRRYCTEGIFQRVFGGSLEVLRDMAFLALEDAFKRDKFPISSATELQEKPCAFSVIRRSEPKSEILPLSVGGHHHAILSIPFLFKVAQFRRVSESYKFLTHFHLSMGGVGVPMVRQVLKKENPREV